MNGHATARSGSGGRTPWWRLFVGSVLWPEETARAGSRFLFIAIPLLSAAALSAQLAQASHTDWEKTVRLQLQSGGYVLPEPEIRRAAEMAKRFSLISAFAGVVQQGVTFVIWAALAHWLLRLMGDRVVFGDMIRILLVACLPAGLLYYGATATAILQSGQYDPTTTQNLLPSNAASWFGLQERTLPSIFLGYVDVFLIWAIAVSIALLRRLPGVHPVKAAGAILFPVGIAATFAAIFSTWQKH